MPSIYVKSASCLLSRPKWNGSLSYAAPRSESPRPLFSARNPRSWLCQHNNIRAVPFILCRPRPGAGFLGSPFPPRSRPGWPSSGSGNSPVPWSKTWLDAGSTPRGAVRT
ncbi:hypothetical protein (mitochondrion) [Glycine soja]|uniref:Uncharacterized protein n=1 Tax=Glycine soja TaxID=3848 RepID=A0A386JNC3_GLYSO|nr:hypothetical protein [Glycine soja]AYD72963.1 hypothetical protein [Glycine soja]